MNNQVLKVKQAMLAMQRYSWEQGVAAQALLESGFKEEAVLFAHDACVRQEATGRLGVMHGEQAVTDPASNGEAVLLAWELTGDARYREAADRMLEYLLNAAPRTGNGAISHLQHIRQVWVDSFYMCPPFLAAAGQLKKRFARSNVIANCYGMRTRRCCPISGMTTSRNLPARTAGASATDGLRLVWCA